MASFVAAPRLGRRGRTLASVVSLPAAGRLAPEPAFHPRFGLGEGICLPVSPQLCRSGSTLAATAGAALAPLAV